MMLDVPWLGVEMPVFNRVVTRYILYRIELLKAASDSMLRDKLKFSDRLTREHVMPIQWQENWPLPDPQNSDLAKRREIAKPEYRELNAPHKRVQQGVGESSLLWEAKVFIDKFRS